MSYIYDDEDNQPMDDAAYDLMRERGRNDALRKREMQEPEPVRTERDG